MILVQKRRRNRKKYRKSDRTPVRARTNINDQTYGTEEVQDNIRQDITIKDYLRQDNTRQD